MPKAPTDVINTANGDRHPQNRTSWLRLRRWFGPLITDLLHSLGTDGKLYLIGIAGKLNLTGMDIMGESKQIIGLIEGDAIPQLSIKSIKLMKFYSFDQVNQAFDDFTSGKVIKPVITFE